MSPFLAEADVERSLLEQLAELGYETVQGPEIAHLTRDGARWYTVAPAPSAEQSGGAERRSGLPDRIAQRPWARRKDVKAAVLRVCRDRYVTLNDLAAALARSADTLRTHYLTEMVEAGEVRLRYPKRPNHPNQAYRASARGRRAR